MKKQQKALERFPLPDQRQRARLASLARSRLEDVYEPIGIDHFALKGDSLDQAMRAMTLRRKRLSARLRRPHRGRAARACQDQTARALVAR